MKNKSTILRFNLSKLLVCTIFLGGLLLNAQEPAAEVPPAPPMPQEAPAAKPVEPFFAAVKPRTHWVVQVSQKTTENTNSAIERLKTIEVTKMKKTIHRVYRWVSGKKTEYWIKDHYIVFENLNNTDIVVFDMNQALMDFDLPEGIADYRKSDFSEIRGVTLQDFKSEENVNNRKAFFYEWQRKASNSIFLPNQNMTPPDAPKEKLWVDRATRLPIRWQRHQETRDFQFMPAKTNVDEFPDRFEKVLQSYLSKLSPRRESKIP